LAELTLDVARGPRMAKLAGAVASKQERKSAKGNRFAFVQLSDPTGLYEITLFSDVLEKCRDHLEPGMNVVVTVEATFESEQLKLLARGVAPIDVAVADAGGAGLRVFVDEEQAVAAVASVLQRAMADQKIRSRGPVQLCLMHPGLPGEVEVNLGSDFPVTPQIKGAIKSLGGVITVEDI